MRIRSRVSTTGTWFGGSGSRCIGNDFKNCHPERSIRMIIPEMGMTSFRTDEPHLRLPDFAVRVALEANPMPQFQIQQAPNAVVIVAMFCAMLVKQALDGFATEVASVKAAGF